jgi:hypothetical protein
MAHCSFCNRFISYIDYEYKVRKMNTISKMQVWKGLNVNVWALNVLAILANKTHGLINDILHKFLLLKPKWIFSVRTIAASYS